jgi:hypothetical protein
LGDAFRAAAAVRARFDPSSLRPFRHVDANEGDAFLQLYEDSFVPYGRRSGDKNWMLKADVRRETLKMLGDREVMIQALDSNERAETRSTLDEIFERYIRGTAPPVEKQGLEELAATQQTIEWLDGVGAIAMPEPQKVQNMIGLKRLFGPFEVLTKSFAGRAAELDWLREFVGVLDAEGTMQSAKEGIARRLRLLLGSSKKNPKLIWGLGGVGKSTLIYEFIQRHVQRREETKFPFIYFDFANPELRLEMPGTLVTEGLRQLALQYPDTVFQTNADSPTGTESPGFSLGTKICAISKQALGTQASKDEQLPLLMVFDSFEEIQYRSRSPELSFVQFFLELQNAYPNVRAVISGRAKPLEVAAKLSLGTNDEREIKDFDEESATAYLKNLGVENPQFRGTLFSQVGGNPLSLYLSAQVYLREGGDEKGIKDLKTSSWMVLKVGNSQIQGQLYERILEHLHNLDVQKLAHPGLILRRITPDIIRQVLQVPCEVSVPDDKTAQELFEEFRREVALVTVAEDGSLHHRSDVRRLMLGSLQLDKSQKVEQIETSAIAYYRSQPGLVARAEEIYHLLRRCEPEAAISARWVRGVEPYLAGAMEELGAIQQLYLYQRLGITAAKELRDKANLEELEAYAVTLARNKMISGYYGDALSQLRERSERTTASRVPLYEIKALIGMENFPEALELLPVASAAEESRGSAEGLLQCALAGAWANYRLGSTEECLQGLEYAEGYARKLDDRTRILKILLFRHDLAGPDNQADFHPQLTEVLSRLTIGERMSNPILVRSVERILNPSPPTPGIVYTLASGYELLSGMSPIADNAAPLTTFEYFLAPDVLASVNEAALRLGFGHQDMRGKLLIGIEPDLAARLPLKSEPSEQIYSDLTELNTLSHQADGTVPLYQWLQNAASLAGNDVSASQTFVSAIDFAAASESTT